MEHSRSSKVSGDTEALRSSPPSVESLPAISLPPALLQEAMTLNALVWPAKVPVKKRVEKRQADAEQDSDVMSQLTWHFVREGGSIIAMARTFRRVVAEASGPRFPVLALAGVCTHPKYRGRGLGRAVVQAAWSRLKDDHLPVCFFQTGVPAFYQRMGAREVANRIYDSTGAPRAFWDPHAMIYPSRTIWPVGAIDLLGGGW